MSPNQNNNLTTRVSRSCDICKAQKVRCIVPPSSSTCKNCQKKNKPCHFGRTKRFTRHRNAIASDSQQAETSNYALGQDSPSNFGRSRPTVPDLYIDRVLADPRAAGTTNINTSVFRAHDNYITSTNLDFFSESKIRLISERLGHDKLQDLLNENQADVDEKMQKTHRSTRAPIKFVLPSQALLVDEQTRQHYLRSYFDCVHPVYPFLDRQQFEFGIRNFDPARDFVEKPSLSALYHAVLALGCQQAGGGSFHPGEGQAWKLYQVSLGLLSDVLYPSDNLVNLQAITAMTIFALNLSCLQIVDNLITEAARMAHCLGYQYLIYKSEETTSCYRVFWVIYYLERLRCLLCNRGPLLADHDIGCPMPDIPESTFSGFNFFLASVKLSRLVSKAHHTLFSISATKSTPEQYGLSMDSLHGDLETWVAALPAKLHPGQPYRPMDYKTQPGLGMMILRLHYMYYALLISICRLRLHVNRDDTQTTKTKQQLLATSRLVIQSTRYIEKQPYTPLWLMTAVPISAMFVLFDFIVFNPEHPETEINLSLMDVAAAYFLRLEKDTKASFLCSKMMGFAHLANNFIQSTVYHQPSHVSVLTVDDSTPIIQDEGPAFAGADDNFQDILNSGHTHIFDELATIDPNLSPISLSYPIAPSQPPANGSFPLGFDFVDLFDIMTPQTQG